MAETDNISYNLTSCTGGLKKFNFYARPGGGIIFDVLMKKNIRGEAIVFSVVKQLKNVKNYVIVFSYLGIRYYNVFLGSWKL